MNPEFAIFGFIFIIAIFAFFISHHLNKMSKGKNMVGDKNVIRLKALHKALHEINDSDSLEEASARVEDLIEEENVAPRSSHS